MKTLEELEQLSIEELEQKALEAPAPVPEGLEARLRQTLTAREVAAAERPRPARWVPYTSLAVAAAAAALLLLPGSGPKDTFDDPYLAYAELERTFRTISDKMSDCVDLAREAGSAAEIPQTVLNKIQSK